MKRLIIATQNKGKAKDFEALFGPLGYDVLTLRDIDDQLDIEETGTTFEANAILKAEGTAAALGVPVIADDSGLEIDALGGEPGVYSARYAGGEKSDEANIDKVLANLAGVPAEQRTARFRCVLAVAAPGRETMTFSGSCEGIILEARQGTNGFGYDPVFFVPELGVSMAELTAEQKGAISHRGAAIRKLKEQLPEWLTETNSNEM